MSNYTKGPWVQFVMDGQCHAIMPAGRPGDVCSFELPPTDADARLMTAAPDMLAALLQQTMKIFDTQADEVEDRRGFWEACSLLLVIWSSGGMPTPQYDPRYVSEYMPLYQAYRKLGAEFRTAVDARAFPI